KSALAGDYESLTERVFGAKLFGRPIDYETSSDAIVRVRANDVRRRLAQYYSQERSGSKIRISLPAGSYIPEFQWLATDPSDTSSPLIGVAAATPAATVEVPS